MDAEKAFDVVDHIHPFCKLYNQGITGSTWLLMKDLYNKTTTQVKCQGQISGHFVNHQGVKQGGILSANFYKAYNMTCNISVFLLLILTLSFEVQCSIILN
jgi:hypothetical protein